jgi:hypothetical protein
VLPVAIDAGLNIHPDRFSRGEWYSPPSPKECVFLFKRMGLILVAQLDEGDDETGDEGGDERGA